TVTTSHPSGWSLGRSCPVARPSCSAPVAPEPSSGLGRQRYGNGRSPSRTGRQPGAPGTPSHTTRKPSSRYPRLDSSRDQLQVANFRYSSCMNLDKLLTYVPSVASVSPVHRGAEGVG